MLRLYLLGPPQFKLDGLPIDLRRRKATALLIYLAVTEKLNHRDALATLFYPDHSQSRARAYLRRDLSALNAGLRGDWLDVDREGLMLKQGAEVWVDIARFRHCLVTAQNHEHTSEASCAHCLGLLAEAADLYANDFLSGFTLRDCPEFDDWQFFQAESLRQELASVLDCLVKGLTGLGDHEATIRHARHRLALDPLHEPAQRQLMQVYARAGQQAAALRQYEEFVRLLEAEFGVPPEEETTTLYEAIKAKRIVAPLLKAEEQRSSRTPGVAHGLSMTPASAPPPMLAGYDHHQLPDAVDEIPFVGREREYARLVAALEQAVSGQSTMMLVEGESGIGKSRLVGEAMRHARGRDINILSGKCYETEQFLPYQVVIHLVDQVLAHWPPETLQQLSPAYLAEIARLVPEITSQFPDLPPPSDLTEAQQGRLFRALARLLNILAEPSGLMLVVDDIQWADRISRQFLNYMVHHFKTDPILLVGIYRSEEVATDNELTALAAAWQQETKVNHLRLNRLSRDEAKALVEQFLQASPQAETFAERLHHETDGHPFFLVSILQSLGEQGLLSSTAEAGRQLDTQPVSRGEVGLMLPDALRQSVHSRLRHLAKATRAVIDLAAVYGRHFDFPMLQAITQVEQSELLDILEDLVTRQLWREVESGRAYDFSHDKIREVVYHDLSSLRRVLMHRQVAAAAEQLTAGKRVGLLADQFEKGEVWDKAVTYLSRAAEQATRLFAMGEAVNFYSRAIKIVEANPDIVDEPARFRLYEQRGQARTFAGQLANGITDLEQVLQFAKTMEDHLWVRALLVELGHACRKADRLEHAIQYLTEALAVARRAKDEIAVADVLFHLGTTSYSAGEYHQAAKYHQEAVEICARLGNIDFVAVQAYHGRGEAYFSTGHVTAAIEYYEKSLDMARQIQNKNYEAENLQMLGFAYSGFVGTANYQQSLIYFTESLAISQKLGLDWLNWVSFSGQAYVLGCTGDYAQALEKIEQHIEQLEAIQIAPRYLSMTYDLYGDLLRDLNLLDQARVACERGLEVATEVQVHFWYPRLQANLAIIRLRQGDLVGEEDLLAALASTAKGGAVYHEVRCLEGLAEFYLALGQPETALEHADYLLAAATPGGMRELLAQAHRWRGEAFLALKDCSAAEAALQQAAGLEQGIGRPRLAWDIHQALAGLYRLRGDQVAAADHAAKIREIVGKLAANLTEERWRVGLPVCPSTTIEA